MPAKTAIINYARCDPAECKDGICQASGACKKKVFKQETPYETPYINSSLCSGCYECIPYCPANAVEKAK